VLASRLANRRSGLRRIQTSPRPLDSAIRRRATDIPRNIDLASLPGPKRGVYPALHVRDEITWSPSSKRFALAYTICEASMSNDIGCIAWGEAGNDRTVILGNPQDIHATCWYTPWAVWVSELVFVFKAQLYCAPRIHLPLVAIHVERGFHVFPCTNNGDSRPSGSVILPDVYTPIAGRALVNAISGAV